MKNIVIDGSQRRSLPEEPGVLFLLEGRCDLAGESYAAPLALPLIPGDGAEIESIRARMVFLSGNSSLTEPVVPDSLSIQIVRETFFDFSVSGVHRRTAVRYVLCRLAECEPAGKSSFESLPETALNYMRRHLDADLKLDDLCAQVGGSKSGLLAAFRRAGYRAPMKELARLRLARARRLLRENELTVAQIARAVGYEDLSAFNHFFRRQTGSSPRRYRENCLWLT
ncbi:MAG: helix-turn-helix domain-containing protein [Kiritimatiellales bacterium]